MELNNVQEKFINDFIEHISKQKFKKFLSDLVINGLFYNNFTTLYLPDNKNPKCTIVGNTYDSFEHISIDLSSEDLFNILKQMQKIHFQFQSEDQSEIDLLMEKINNILFNKSINS